MALIGSRTAFVPVGMSCQPAHQVRLNAKMIGELTGDPPMWVQLPFDWTICGAIGVSKMLADLQTFPDSISELRSSADDLADGDVKKPYWEARSCWFWHVKGPFVQARARALLQKHMLAELNRSDHQLVFVWSNLQNNLVRIEAESGGFRIIHTFDEIEVLSRELLARFGRRAQLHVISRPGLVRGPKPLSDFAQSFTTLHWFERDRSQWQGDDAQWSAVLRKIIDTSPALRR